MGRKVGYEKVMSILLRVQNTHCPSCDEKGGIYSTTSRITKKRNIEFTCINCNYIHDPYDRLTDAEIREKRIDSIC